LQSTEAPGPYEVKQLANVLIRILGLSVCVHTIPSLVSAHAVAAAVHVAIGIALIAKSQTVAEFLFKTEEE